MWANYQGGYMLVKCSECGKEISDKAQTCIHCGAPLKGDKQTVHVEATDKDIKVTQIIASIILILGCIGMVFTEYSIFFYIVLGIGGIIHIYNGWKTWWRYR